jgi:dienelactone hydrolase
MAGIMDRWRRRGDKAPEREAGGAALGASDPNGLCLDPYETLAHLAGQASRALSWSRAGIADPGRWQDAARVKLAELSGYGRFGGPLQVLRREDCGAVAGLRHESLYIHVRHAHDIPVRIVRKAAADAPPRTAVVCLQGEGIGMRASWGETDGEKEAEAVRSGFDFASEAAARGHVAVCVELMGAGERSPRSAAQQGAPLRSLAVHGMLLGHSLLGQHASDISAVVNWLTGRNAGIGADAGRIAVIGHNLGAAAGLLASALDTRIAAVAMVGPPLRFRDAIKRRAVTAETTMPGLLRWMDLDDILLLCAPRPVLAAPGKPGGAACELLAGARPFYELLDAGSALIETGALPPLWDRLTAVLAE